MSKHTSHLIILLVATAFFMEYIDSTALVTALPTIASDFRVPGNRMGIGITAYMISMAVFIPASGWVAGRYGTRTVFASAVMGFIIASVLCSVSRGLTWFAIMRFVQGMAGAMMVPVGRLAVLKTCEKKDLVNAIAWITTPGLVAPLIGPPLGGLLTTCLSWHWIFFINVPLGLIVFLLATRYLPRRSRGEAVGGRRLDVIGFILSGVALSGLMYGLELCGGNGRALLTAAGVMALSVGLLWLNVRHAARTPSPLIDYSVMRIPAYGTVVAFGLISMMVIGAAPFLLPMMFQDGLSLDALHAGLLLLALMAGNLITKPFTVWMMRRWKGRHILFVNALLLSLATAACALFRAGTPWVLIIGCLFLMGCFRSVQLSMLHTVAYMDVPQARMNDANTIYSTGLQLASGLGIGLGALALRCSEAVSGSAAPLSHYHAAFAFVGAFGLLALIGYSRMKIEHEICESPS